MTEIRKDRKYILQFPEGTSVDQQKMVIGKMEESLKSDDRFTVIDPKVKVYEAEKVIEEVPKVEEKVEAKVAEPVKEEAPKVEENAPEPVASDGIKVEKVEISSPATEAPKPKEPLSESGNSSEV